VVDDEQLMEQVAKAEAEEPAAEAVVVDAADLEAVRAMIQRAYPDTVAELLVGATVGELLAAVPVAQAAYRTVAEQLREAAPEPVPAGGVVRGIGFELEGMSPGLKIREGLKRAG